MGFLIMTPSVADVEGDFVNVYSRLNKSKDRYSSKLKNERKKTNDNAKSPSMSATLCYQMLGTRKTKLTNKQP